MHRVSVKAVECDLDDPEAAFGVPVERRRYETHIPG
jgi:hypothetical protein